MPYEKWEPFCNMNFRGDYFINQINSDIYLVPEPVGFLDTELWKIIIGGTQQWTVCCLDEWASKQIGWHWLYVIEYLMAYAYNKWHIDKKLITNKVNKKIVNEATEQHISCHSELRVKIMVWLIALQLNYSWFLGSKSVIYSIGENIQ